MHAFMYEYMSVILALKKVPIVYAMYVCMYECLYICTVFPPPR